MARHVCYHDRADAGRQLADAVARRLEAHELTHDPLVLALPRGGVPVAVPVAAALSARVDVLVVRKVGAPGHEELAIGAVAAGLAETGGDPVMNDDLVARLRLSPDDVATQTERARRELAARSHRLRGDRPPPIATGRTVVLIDDGMATGATMRASVAAIRAAAPAAVVVAVPVGAPEACAMIAALVDELVCPLQPRSFGAVGQWYDDFTPTTDDDVRRVLDRRD
ncbi:MAG: phosphoribosyltransferase [Acidimicrobiia bacterium]|nr:phosphoribosyltransferase [Acidimicrobiia bacterium]